MVLWTPIGIFIYNIHADTSPDWSFGQDSDLNAGTNQDWKLALNILRWESQELISEVETVIRFILFIASFK